MPDEDIGGTALGPDGKPAKNGKGPGLLTLLVIALVIVVIVTSFTQQEPKETPSPEAPTETMVPP